MSGTYMRAFCLLILSLGLFSTQSFAQLDTGDVAIIAFNADGDDDFAIVALADIPASQVIYFTDNEWNGSAFTDLNEGELTWTNAGSILAAGSVVTFTDVSTGSGTASVGTLSGSNFNLGASNEWFYALLSAPATSYASTPTFLAAFANDAGSGWLASTGLTEGSSAIDFNNDQDGFEYTGARTGESSFADYKALIYNTSNWQQEASNGENILPIDATSFTTASGDAPSNFQFVHASSDKINITWDKPSGTYNTDWDGVLVFVSDGSSGIDLSLSGQDGVDYTANLTYGSGTFATDAGASENAYCVANQTTDANGDIVVTGLTEGTTYYVYAYGYAEVSGNSDNDTFSSQVDGGNQSADLENLSGAGTTTGNAEVTLNWTNPTTTQGTYWDRVVIVAREASAVEAAVSAGNLDALIDGSSLSANADWSARSNTNDLFDQTLNLIGSDNTNYVVYNGTGTSATITGLTNGTTYHFRAFVYYTEDDTDENWTTGTDLSDTPADVPSAGDVVISEIMYNSSGTDDEWIEIYNASGAQITLDASWRLSYSGNTFDFTGTTFEAGDYLVIGVGSDGSSPFNPDASITPDIAAVGTVGTIATTNNTNNMLNSSATISVIYDPSGSNITIDEVTYDDGSPWPTAADGTGPSLELTDVALDNSVGSNWAASSDYDGGTAGSAYNTFQYDNAWNNTPSTSTGTVDAQVDNGTASFSADAAINDVTIASGAVLTISAGVLTINGDIVNNGTVNVSNDASLYQTASTDNNSGSGTYNVSRTSRAYGGDQEYSYWSSPVSGETMGDAFSGSNTSDFYSFTASTQAWASEGNSTTMTPGVGFITTGTIGITGSETRTFSASTVNNGDVSVSVSFGSDNAAADSDDYNLVGNPYPSALDWHLVAADGDNSELSGTIWFWYHESYPTDNSDYATYNSSGGTGGNTSITPTRYIGTGQGFFVELDAATDNSITFKNSHRVSNSNNQFYKRNQSDNINRVWLALTNDQNDYNQILVAFANGATEGRDRLYDGRKLKGHPSLSLYSLIDGEPYAIQGQNKLSPGETRVIPLGVDAWVTGTYGIGIDSIQNLPQGYEIELLDTETQIRTDLRQASYSVDVLNTGSIENRFYLVITHTVQQAGGGSPVGQDSLQQPTGVEEVNANAVKLYQVGETWFIDSGKELKSVTVYNLQGRLLEEREATETLVRISSTRFQPGVYFVNLQYQDNTRSVHSLVKP